MAPKPIHVTNDARIRVIPANEDPRLRIPGTANGYQQPPQLDEANFPALPTSTMKPHDTTQTLLSSRQTWSDVAQNGVILFGQFAQLPVEVRELVWMASLQAEGKINPASNGGPVHHRVYPNGEAKYPCFLPRLCLVSKSMRDETIGVFMRNSAFIIPSFASNTFFRKFIASVEKGPNHVRNLYFPNFDFFPYYDRQTRQRVLTNSDLELAVDCHGLRKVALTFGARHLRQTVLTVTEDTEEWSVRPMSVEELVDRYRLRRLLDCENLRTIHLDGKHHFREEPEVLHDIAYWLKAEFAKINRQVECEVTWRP
jgi:hypothetical protein